MRYSDCLLLAVAALGGCARADGAFDRLTLAKYRPRPVVAISRPREPAQATVVIGDERYAGQTRLIAQGGACPPDAGVLTVGGGGRLRYSDAANGVLVGELGTQGQVNISRGPIRLDGRLAETRFEGTVDGGRCAYQLALRRGGISVPSAVGLAYAAPAVSNIGTSPESEPVSADQVARPTRIVALPRARRATTQPVEAEPLPVPAEAASTAVVPPASAAQQAGVLLAQGRVAAARPLYERAAAAGDATAATAVGKTYDPLFLANMHVNEVEPNPKLAAAWYRRAAELGDPRASSRLSSLEAMQQQ